ncbi:PIG-L deacetylase family protein [Jiangella alba]|nr:PIG-L family deacetylase [Jiangella alba]
MKIMTIYAHPADTITNCGGTLAQHAQRGDEVVALILSHGGRIHANKYAEEWRKDAPDDAVAAAGLDAIVANKKDELDRAAKIIGIDRIITLDHEDTYATVHEDVVEEIAEHLAAEQPEIVIADHPRSPAYFDAHSVATGMALAALARAGTYLRNLDGRDEVPVRQVFLTGLPVYNLDALSLNGVRNDCYVDITGVVGTKLAAMDQFVSQGYHGVFARKLVESYNGEAGRAAGVNFAEAFVRLYNETHQHLPVTEAALATDPLTRHIAYSSVNLRGTYPVR